MSSRCHIVSPVDRDDGDIMNAEDLVITFKRDIASLSRIERRRLRLRSRILPALRVRRGREEGEGRERRAALPLPGLRQDLRHGQRAVSVNLFFTSFAKQAHRSRKGGFTGCANVFSPIPVTA